MPDIGEITSVDSCKTHRLILTTTDGRQLAGDISTMTSTVGEYSQIIKICHFVNPKYYHTIYNITRIYYAFLLSMQTDTYGDVPVKYYIKGALPPVTGAVYSKTGRSL